ncbi:bifunctional adenosylcobinamide kinase/adenosylcobinamide-phosphate guanylyltransferase [Clostridium sp. E02]|uniref:bifunctional adenosylcobinamide kinase/adenosylcobinamide-phosphate guanylyltransferase n=1 Tax=Clostridium sp. E02 TaxID=2487134 RepID=UPI000F524D8E|nr:bifunctional adenosylcobinamide kinase/adenosylcobinamide-phosphate guanylyltransferase [Clostridium sp. E02]
MIALVTGGSGSGKSEYAENLISRLGVGKRIYIATMKPWDEECRKRILRHQVMRQEKQFETIECYSKLNKLTLPQESKVSAVLLECMSNLVSNELFGFEEEVFLPSNEFVEKQIMEGIKNLSLQTNHLVIVTNEVFSDGDYYSAQTNHYRMVLGQINQKIADMANLVVEVVAGIPIVLKNEFIENNPQVCYSYNKQHPDT